MQLRFPDSSITNYGFKIGGKNGHPMAHGNNWVRNAYQDYVEVKGPGIYGCTTAKFPVENFNQNSRVLIGMRALPGSSTTNVIREHAGGIQRREYDSIYGEKDGVCTYVIRRTCQTLPCFLIYYA
jgi:hypothetical protein